MGIARVFRGVVKEDGECQKRALGKTNRLQVSILILPVEIPILDPEQRLNRPVGESRRQAKFAAEVMGVGHDRVKMHVRLDSRADDDRVPLVAGGNVDLVRAKCEAHHIPRHGFLGGEEADARTIFLRFAAAVVVDSNDNVGTVGHPSPHAIRSETRRHAGSPSAQTGVGELCGSPRPDIPQKPWCRVGKVASPGIAGRVEIDSAVVHDPSITRPELDAVDDKIMPHVDW